LRHIIEGVDTDVRGSEILRAWGSCANAIQIRAKRIDGRRTQQISIAKRYGLSQIVGADATWLSGPRTAGCQQIVRRKRVRYSRVDAGRQIAPKNALLVAQLIVHFDRNLQTVLMERAPGCNLSARITGLRKLGRDFEGS